MELAWPWQRHPGSIFHRLNYNKFICMCFFVGNDSGKIYHTAANAKGLPDGRPKWMSQGSSVPDFKGRVSLLQARANMKALKQVHAQLVTTGLDQNVFLKTQFVIMYVKCGSMENARLVFDKMRNPNVFLWNLMIRGYTRSGQAKEALRLYDQMQRTGIEPNKFTFPLVLKACASISALQEGKEIHDHIVNSGFESDVFVGNSLVAMYAKCGCLAVARQLFDKMSKRDVVSWNAMIVGCAQNGRADEALTLFNQMQLEDVIPDSVTMVSLVQACACLGDLQQGKWIHDYIIRCGFESDVFVMNSLVAMYAKCCNLELAREVFDKLSKRNVASWNAMIAGYAQNGYANEALALFSQMQRTGLKSDSVTMISVLMGCSHLEALQQGKWMHGYIIKSGFESDIVVGTTLIDMYAKCGVLEIARLLFDEMPERNVVSWSAMIGGYAQNGYAIEALTLFSQMQLEGIKPNSVTMVGVLLACAYLSSLQQGKWIHGYIIKSGFESDVVVATTLIDMYAKCRSLEIARLLFDNMPKRNVVSWSAMIAGYAQNGHVNEALTIFNQMKSEDMKPNSVTIMSVLSACSHSGALQQGKWIHDYIIQSGLELCVSVENSLVDMYARCGSVEFARQLFDRMSKRNVVSWNAMIAGYVQNGHANEALSLFNQMHLAGMAPDSVTLVTVLPACAHLAALQQGKWIHGYILGNGFELDVVLGTALIDMYAKCGNIEIARQLFDEMSVRNVVSWNVIIAGYGMHGHGKDAIALFSKMQQTGMKPDHITFVCVLSACSHAGLVDEGWRYFDGMSQYYCIPPRAEHYACMVDLLGRAGRLDEARDFIENMPFEPGASVWGALLGACRIHVNIELGELVAERLFHLEPEHSGFYVLLSNIYAAAGRWDDVTRVRTMMKDRGMKKTPGCTIIEVNNRVHAFLVGDRSHPQSEKIYAALETLAGQLKEAGYVPNTDFVLHDVDEEVKTHLLGTHSEKLAIVFGLINTSPGTQIRITKNLRVCGDCHSATKFISKIVKREIIVRDANRFHNFKDGFCSCGDYW